MDLRKGLIESGKLKKKRNWRGVATSMVAHSLALGAVIFGSLSASEQVAAEEKAIPVYVQQSAAAPPPPPPPPPPAASSAPSQPQPSTPVQQPEPVQTPPDSFTAPVEEPEELPEVPQTVTSVPSSQSLSSLTPGPTTTNVSPAGVPGGVAGGVVGGVSGGEIGGQLGGQLGGVVGGVVGGTPGGQLGGQVGGTGTEPAPAPPAPSGPVRVGGNVKAPIVVHREDPEYTEVARRARVGGVVVVEAIIDRNGNVDKVTVVKGLPMGLSDSAVAAVRRWKFKPGTMGGRPVDVIFNLTVVFRLGADGGPATTVKQKSRPKPAPQPVEEAPAPESPPAEEPAPLPDSPENPDGQ